MHRPQDGGEDRGRGPARARAKAKGEAMRGIYLQHEHEVVRIIRMTEENANDGGEWNGGANADDRGQGMTRLIAAPGAYD